MPRIVSPLSATQVANAKATGKRYRLHDGGGLVLEVSPTGNRRWLLRHRVGSADTYAAVVNAAGSNAYPEMGLAEARKLAHAVRKTLAQGINPATQRKMERASKEADLQGLFKAVAERWHRERSPHWSPDTARKARLVLDTYLYPHIADLPIATLTTAQVKPVLAEMGGKTPALARKARQYLSQIVEYAIQEGLREDGKILMLKGVLPKKDRGHYPAATTDKTLPLVLAALSRISSIQSRTALWLCVYTAVRPGVAVSAKWQDINLETGEWLIPAEDMKQGFAHITPLPTQMIARLKEMRALFGVGVYVFPPMAGRKRGSRGRVSGHMSRDTLSAALRDIGLRGITVTHGLRATMRTMARERLNIAPEVLEAQLAHAKKGEVQAAYDRTQLLAERKTLIQTWADYLTSVCSS